MKSDAIDTYIEMSTDENEFPYFELCVRTISCVLGTYGKLVEVVDEVPQFLSRIFCSDAKTNKIDMRRSWDYIVELSNGRCMAAYRSSVAGGPDKWYDDIHGGEELDVVRWLKPADYERMTIANLITEATPVPVIRDFTRGLSDDDPLLEAIMFSCSRTQKQELNALAGRQKRDLLLKKFVNDIVREVAEATGPSVTEVSSAEQ